MINKDIFAQALRFQSVSVPSVQLSEFIPVPFRCTYSGWKSPQGNSNIMQDRYGRGELLGGFTKFSKFQVRIRM